MGLCFIFFDWLVGLDSIGWYMTFSYISAAVERWSARPKSQLHSSSSLSRRMFPREPLAILSSGLEPFSHCYLECIWIYFLSLCKFSFLCALSHYPPTLLLSFFQQFLASVNSIARVNAVLFHHKHAVAATLLSGYGNPSIPTAPLMKWQVAQHKANILVNTKWVINGLYKSSVHALTHSYQS